MSDRRQLLSNLLSLTAVRGLDYLVPLITLPYLVRVLGIEGFGLVNYALSFALYFAAVMQYGFSVTAVRKIARSRENPEQIAAIYSETLTAIALLVGVCAMVYFPTILLIDSFRQHLSLYVYSFYFVAAQALFPIWFFQGMENMRQSAMISITSKVLLLGGIFIFIREQEDYYRVPALNAAAMLGCALFSVYWIAFRYRTPYIIPRLSSLKAVYRDGGDAFVSQLAPNLYNNSAAFLLGAFGGPTMVGIFAAASRVIDVFNSAGLIISNAFFPYLARNPQAIAGFHKIMVMSGAVLTVGCFVFAEPITAVLFSNENIEIARYIRLMSASVIACFLNISYHNNGLMLVGRDDLVRKISVWTSMIFFALGFVLVPRFDIYGAVIMVLGGRLIMAALGLYLYKRAR